MATHNAYGTTAISTKMRVQTTRLNLLRPSSFFAFRFAFALTEKVEKILGCAQQINGQKSAKNVSASHFDGKKIENRFHCCCRGRHGLAVMLPPQTKETIVCRSAVKWKWICEMNIFYDVFGAMCRNNKGKFPKYYIKIK